jgi:hypothetical protein
MNRVNITAKKMSTGRCRSGRLVVVSGMAGA